ncbi:raffinose/stachyose/melibiose transport system substrate-binding protein [Microbacterium sp. AK009]|uniref:ABC transporter substrate-binding protein n=1 Tax=Microbacterium sp. AK009 TaxID=2723068 RepID=UPI0015C9662C|nr:extracellular solute-binding protein [Microbacterium sp. AK009]NYF16615.1 raffinose/stachyose/melibiose transport system substrate-binding protein [Microbacterium sp. AK009]
MTSNNKRRPRQLVIASTAIIGLGLAGCSAGSSEEPSSDVFQLWYGFEPGQSDAITDLIAEWDEANEDVTVEITAMGPELNPPSLLPALSSGEGPDMWAGAVGPGQPQAFIDGGLVVDLTPYYCEFDWGSQISDDLAAITTVDGQLFAVPYSIESTGMFYRKSIFEDLGISIPTTWNEFIEVVNTLAENGYETPIGAAGQDAWPVTQLLGAMWGTAAGPEGLDQTLFGDGAWTDPPFIEASDAFVSLQDSGFFGPEPLAFSYQATMADFYNGVVPMTYTGGFVIPGAQEDAGENFDDIGVFALPSVSGGPIYANESPGGGWYINANSDKADIAADLLNFLFFNDESRTQMLQGGLVPPGEVNLDEVELPSVLEELLAENNTYRENGVIPAFLEVVTPGALFEVQMDEVQGVLSGSVTGPQLSESYQAAWEAEKANGNTLAAGGSPEC